MKYLHSWIQEYIEESVPKGEDFVKVISTNAFEVEEYFEIENKLAKNESEKKDYIYDLNVLPNRAHDALSHYYMAKEVAALFGFKMKENENHFSFGTPLRETQEKSFSFSVNKTDSDFIKIADPKACTRFMGCKVNNILVKDSPDFIKYRLEAIGQKSINNIVDITNYIQFSYNKPMHAYDADLISEYLEARFANVGETMTTLDNKELNLDEKTLVIADAKNVLGLAGIKGGKYSGISSETKNVIVESANFNPVLIRKTSQKYNLKTDASKRFENEIADELTEIGMIETLRLIKEYASDGSTEIIVGEIVDNFPKKYHVPFRFGVSNAEISKLIGVDIYTSKVEEIFNRFGFEYEKVIPKEIIEKLAEEVEGKPYHLGASVRYDAPNLFDCSSLISWLYKESGIQIPRISVDQFVFTKRIEDKDLRFGDLIFVNNDVDKVWHHSQEYMRGVEVSHGINHVGMYLGNGKVLHATTMFGKVVIEDLKTAERFKDIVGYGRVLENLEEERFVVTIPEERLDLRIKEDLIEEVARVFGLNNIKSEIPNLNKKGHLSKRGYFANKVKEILFKNGFSEVMTYSLRNKGDIEILKSVAQDKNYLRNNLSNGIEEAVQKNIFNMPLLNLNEIKIFEFGNCFAVSEEGKEKEWLSLAIAIDDGKKNKNYTEIKNNILEEIKNALEVKEIEIIESKNLAQKENRFEINFDELIKDLEEGEGFIDLGEMENKEAKYKSFPLTPFIVRDIAFWTGDDANEEDLRKIIEENISKLCISVILFDKFEKEIDGVMKKSFGFRLIYQDKERTLTDEEVNQEADKVYGALKAKGFEIR
ncbi:MAG: phenylalanyl-tRNA synthetase beta chain [Patescibacteria group bacterium]|nr:phenylalanyl-tRNA synthetase beta chain [Patescibacteria group bacterium]